MRILHVIPSLAATDGGPTTAVLGMTSQLAILGHDVVIATTHATGAVDGVRETASAGVRLQSFARRMKPEWKYSPDLGRWLRTRVHDFDAVHVHAVFSHASHLGCSAARAAGVPYVVRPLGSLDPWALAQRNWRKRAYLRTIGYADLAGASLIHAASAQEARAIVALGFGDSVRLVHLGVDAIAVDERPDREAGPLRVLFMSRLHPGKNVPVLLEALQQLVGRVDFHARIAGTGEASYVAKLRNEAASRGLTENANFVGHASPAERAALLEWADVLVLPSSHESFGIAVAEALASGVPVVISENVGIADLVAGAGAGLVLPNDASAIASALLELAHNPLQRKEMSLAAVDLARSEFSWRSICLRLVSVYEELASTSLRAQRGSTS